MYSDGVVSYYLIQHETTARPGVDARWADSALDHVLFNGMSPEDKRGALGDHRRALLEPQSAGSEMWQRFGIHGYGQVGDVLAALKEARIARPGMNFRLAHRTITQATIPQNGM